MAFWTEALELAQTKYLELQRGTTDRVVIGGTEYTRTNSKQLLDEIERLELKARAEAAGAGSPSATSPTGGRRIHPTLGRP